MLPADQRPEMVHLPYFGANLPLLYSEAGIPCIPTYSACRLLGIDPEHEILHTRRILLWGSARKLRITHDGTTFAVWGFDYPISFTYWLGSLSQEAPDPIRQQQLNDFVRWGISLSGKMHEELREQWKDVKKRMFRLNAAVLEAQEIITQLRSQQAAFPSEAWHGMEQALDLGHTFGLQVHAFVQRWLKEQEEEVLIFDGITIDAEGNDMNQPFTFPLFAAVRQSDATLLALFERWSTAWIPWLKTQLRPS